MRDPRQSARWTSNQDLMEEGAVNWSNSVSRRLRGIQINISLGKGAEDLAARRSWVVWRGCSSRLKRSGGRDGLEGEASCGPGTWAVLNICFIKSL